MAFFQWRLKTITFVGKPLDHHANNRDQQGKLWHPKNAFKTISGKI